jgi:methyl coenzyme M reductase subunit C
MKSRSIGALAEDGAFAEALAAGVVAFAVAIGVGVASPRVDGAAGVLASAAVATVLDAGVGSAEDARPRSRYLSVTPAEVVGADAAAGLTGAGGGAINCSSNASVGS